MKNAAIQRGVREKVKINWSDELLVYQPSATTESQSKDNIPVFGDDRWALHGFQWKPTATTTTMIFFEYPNQWKNVAKRIAWCLLNLEAPIDKIQRPNASRTRISKATAIVTMTTEIKPFLVWLADQGTQSLSDVTKKQLHNYRDEIAKSGLSRNYKARRLWGPTRFWLYSEYLLQSDQLIQPPWELEGTAELLGPANWSAENLTVPINPLTMSPLLTWAQLFVDKYSDEIVSAVKTKNELRSKLRSFSYEGERECLIKFLDDFHAAHQGLPGYRGNPGKEVNIGSHYLSVYVGVGTNCIRHEFNKRVRNGQKPIESAPLSDNRSIYVGAQPLLPFIDYYTVDKLKLKLVASCLIVIAYLSGMRIEEARGLQRGCCKKIDGSEGTFRFEIWAKSYKDAVDLDGNTIHGGRIREEPWHVIQPVAKAIQVMESLHDEDNLFSATALLPWTRRRQEFVISLVTLQKNINEFITWCNSTCEKYDLLGMVIPEDPGGTITTARFRRTLAWFIYRLPAGRISLGIQYGHLQGMTSDGYGSRVSTGLRDLFPMEEAFARADTLAIAAEKLSDGELVSGPAADRYIKGVTEFAVRFQGKYLSTRQAAELRRDPIFRIYDNGMQPLACCYDSAKAMCHPDREIAQSIEATPNLSRCDSRCPNAARTDSHIDGLRQEIKWQLAQSKSDLVPEPMRLRHKQRIVSLRAIIKKHKVELKRIEEKSIGKNKK